MEYEKLYRAHAGRYLVWSFSGLLIVCAAVYYLLAPQWPTAVMVIFYCAGFVLCISGSAMLGKRRAQTILQERENGSTKRDVSTD